MLQAQLQDVLPASTLPDTTMQTQLSQVPTCDAAAHILQAHLIPTLPDILMQTKFSQVPTCNAAAHILQAQLQDILPIQGDGALQGLHQTEQGHDEGGLAAAGASDNADLLAGRDVKGDTLQGD